MAKKIITDKNIKEIKKNIKEKKVIIGTEKCLKALRKNEIKKVFITSNCQEKTEEKINYYAKLNNVEVVKLNKRNDELGIICKKPFNISMLCI